MKKYLLALTVLNIAFAQTPAASDRKALIIGISEYNLVGTPLLPGVRSDIESATKIALAMGIPQNNITYIKESEATKPNILRSIKAFGDSTTIGTRAFVYFSGHGNRSPDPKTGECVDVLLTYEGQGISNAEFASVSQNLNKSADKVITMFDACYSEGTVGTKSRSFTNLTPKFASNSSVETCKAINPLKPLVARGLLPETTRLGALQENFVQITSSRPDEISYDLADGGVATSSFRDCLLGSAKDLNASGGVSMAEIQTCAQTNVNKLLGTHTTQHVSVAGNRNLIPVLFQEPPKPVTPEIKPPVQLVQAPELVKPLSELKPTIQHGEPAKPHEPQVTQNISLVVPIPSKPPIQDKPTVIVEKPPEITKPQETPIKVEPLFASLATLKDIEQQRNPKKIISVQVNKPTLRIGKDYLDLSITSKSDGYLYLVLLGSDAKSFYLLYPNGIDHDNFIKAGQTVRVPKPNWGILAAGPDGTDRLLVMVADSPRKLDNLTLAEPTEKSPYTYALNDLGGRQALINYLTGSGIDGHSETFGAQLVNIKEVK